MQISRRTALAGAVVVATGTATTSCAPKKADSTSSAFKPDVKTAEVGDISMAYYTRGEGEPLLMINGFMASMSLWDPALIEALAERHQVILFDNRGVGRSTDTEKDVTTIPQMADDAAGLIRALGFEKANVLAYSMGARASVSSC